MLDLVSTPFGLALVGLFVSQFVIEKFEFEDKKKVFASWGVGIALTTIMLVVGLFAQWGAFAGFNLSNYKDWIVFALVALSTGLISNGYFSSGFFEKILNFFKK